MEVRVIKGATTEAYFELVAQTRSECMQLVAASESEFIPRGKCILISRGNDEHQTLALRIYC